MTRLTRWLRRVACCPRGRHLETIEFRPPLSILQSTDAPEYGFRCIVCGRWESWLDEQRVRS